MRVRRQLLAEPGDTDADDGEDDGLEQRGLREVAAAYKQDAERDAQRRSEQPRTEAAKAGGKQHRRDEDEEGAAIPQPRVQSPGQHEPNHDNGRGRPIMGARGRGIEERSKEALESAFGARGKRAMHDEFYPFLTRRGT